MDIVTDLTTEAVSYLTLFQDLLKSNPKNEFLKKLITQKLTNKEAWDELNVSEIEINIKALTRNQKNKIKDLIFHSPTRDNLTVLSKQYFTVTLHLLQWLATHVGKTVSDTTNDDSTVLLAQIGENDEPNLFRPPFFWRQQIKEVLYTNPEKRIILAEKLQYMPLQLILALDKNVKNSYKIRLYQFYIDEAIKDQLNNSDFVLENEDLNIHNTWWEKKYADADRLLKSDKDLLENLIKNDITLPFETLFREELLEISEARKYREKELTIFKNKKQNTNTETSAINDSTSFDPLKKAKEMQLIGIAFSGGGIRSASFNLGILQRLASLNTLHRFDYISSVSGGGYIATWFNLWVQRTGSLSKISDRLNPEKSRDPLADEVRPIRWLRMFSNYLSPNTGIMSSDAWASGMTWIRNTLIIQFVLLLTLITILSCINDIYLGSCWLKGKIPDDLTPWEIFGISLGMFTAGSLLAAIAMRSFHKRDKIYPGIIGTLRLFILTDLMPIIPHLLVGWGAVCAFLISTYCAAINKVNYCGLMGISIASFLPFLFLAISGNYHKRQDIKNNGKGNVVSNDDEKTKKKPIDWRIIVAIFISSAVASAILGLLLGIFWYSVINADFKFENTDLEKIKRDEIMLVIGVPIILEIFSIAVIARMALMGRLFPDYRREWWGRMGGYIHRFIFFWIIVSFASLIMPHLRDYFWEFTKDSEKLKFLSTLGISGGWFGLIGWGVKKAFEANDKTLSKSRTITTIIIKAIPYLFMIGFLLIGAWITEKIKFSVDSEFQDKKWFYNPLFVTLFLAIITGAISWRVGVNEFSLHHFYRNRLTRAFLGATRTREDRIKTANVFTGFDTNDDIMLSSMTTKNRYWGPYPIINATLNATVVSALDRQDRKGESFIFSPLYSGYDFSPTRSSTYNVDHVYEYGYRPTEKFSNEDGGITIGTAMAISGAAVNPNWGHDSSASLAFLLTVFNVRLGWWIGNPRLKKWKKSDPGFGFIYLLMDLIGKSDINMEYVCLSDGGHFDNMGLYELVRRRCKYILVGDAEQDQEGSCEGLANAIRRCRIDFGVEININLDDLFKKANDKDHKTKHIIKGKIIYPGETQQIGTLVYIKTTLSGNEPVDIREYALANPDFPQQSTIDQFFDEAQFESYRKLGYHSINNLKELGLPY